MRIELEIPEAIIQDLLYGHGTDSWLHDATGNIDGKGIVCVYDLASEGEGEGNGRKTLTRADVKRGLELMAKESPSQFADALGDSADRMTTDTFYQYMIFGELIYC